MLVPAIAAIATAWTGYQAARGDGAQSVLYGEATRDRFAAAAATVGGQQLVADSAMFNGWLQARAANDPQLQAVYVRRFTPDYRSAFAAWLKTGPFTNPSAPRTWPSTATPSWSRPSGSTTRPRRRSPREQRRARPRTSTSAATVGATVIDVPRRTGLVRLSDRSPLAQAVLPASCLEKYWRAVLVCCLPVKSTPRAVRNPLDSAATWNAWLGGHLVDSSRIREPSG